MSSNEERLAIELGREQARTHRYFDRMKRSESNLAEIRAALGVTGRPHVVTLQRLDDLFELALEGMIHDD